MSRWDGFGRFWSAPKLPPPAHGIKMKKSGATWWGRRWIEALAEVLHGDAGRLARGRTYARAGRTHGLVVDAGTVCAQVTGSRPRPYEVTVRLVQLPEAAWRAAIAAMAEKAQFSADLLAGRMPAQIDEAFRAADCSLFPARRSELTTSCTCPDWGDPCKHVAATHYVLGEALDRDPFLLFELRGRTKAQVLAALREARADRRPAGSARADAPSAGLASTEIPTVTLPRLKPADYDRPRATLPALSLSFDAPVAHGALLQQLGSPAAWSEEGSPAEVLAPLVRAAAERARGLAMAEPPEPQHAEVDDGRQAAAGAPGRARPSGTGRAGGASGARRKHGRGG